MNKITSLGKINLILNVLNGTLAGIVSGPFFEKEEKKIKNCTPPPSVYSKILIFENTRAQLQYAFRFFITRRLPQRVPREREREREREGEGEERC